MALETAASNDVAFGFTGPELIGLGFVGVAAYYVGKRVFRALSGEKSA